MEILLGIVGVVAILLGLRLHDLVDDNISKLCFNVLFILGLILLIHVITGIW